MAIFGIVSEFNPFHKGHKYLVDRARELGASAVVTVMSGNATQRGELALTDKYNRAEMALAGGVDLVLELPYPFSSASAEFFARGALSLLSHICDTVIFGSECGDIELLRHAAEYAAGEEFKALYRALLLKGGQSAAAYLSLIREKTGTSLSSNDILGVEYIKAAHLMGISINFITVKREGSGYLCDVTSSDGSPDSAMAIRELVYRDERKMLEERLPSSSYELLCRAKDAGELVDKCKFYEAARLFFRLHAASDLSDTPCLEGGIAERICRVAHESLSGEDFMRQLSTKRYTDAKLRRGLLFALTGVKHDDLLCNTAYTCLLAANGKGREFLSGVRKGSDIRVITKPADASELADAAAKRQTELSARLDALYTFCLSNSAESGALLRKKPHIT